MTHELIALFPAPLRLGWWIWRCSCGHQDQEKNQPGAYRAWQEHQEIAHE